MKTCAITGHTKGIGKAISDKLSLSYNIIGFSRSNGFDISIDQGKIIKESQGADIFINNAFVFAK